MYENQNPNVYGQKQENSEYSAESGAVGRFSQQTPQDTYHSVNSTGTGTVNTGINPSTDSVNTGINSSTDMTNTGMNTGAERISAAAGVGTNGNTGRDLQNTPVRSNSYYSQNGSSYGTTWQNTNYGQNNNSYQYGNTYPNSYSAGYEKAEKKKDKSGKKEKTGGGYFKKVLVSVSLGLFFGICAGIGLYAVEAATGMLDKDSETVNTAVHEDAGNVAGTDAGSGKAKIASSDSVAHGTDEADVKKTKTVSTVVSDVSDVVSEVMPAAVSISNTYTQTLSYFGQAMTNEAEASGSGIIVGENDTELLIVTNYHVIEDADKLSVQFVEGSEAEASVKGTDADMDLAVIAVPLENISSSTLNQISIATLGDSDTLKIGEPAIAIGNSLGYGQSVTTGVISALDREMELEDGSTGTFIQTDAAINPGNSGGALLNIEGKVIGINSNKIGGSVIEGMGYAIPISAASPIIADLMLKETKNKVAEDERGFLGISGISVTAEVSSAYGMPKGVYIAQVYDGTAAAAAGLKKGDIITAFDGDSVSSMDELQRLLEYAAKGDTVEVEIMTVGNDGYQSKTVSVTLGNRVEQ
ncbi:MAG: trypsin-like peptidase domain-containing protein [Blautia sp.]|nr:trypsin-like peptidase domain-containing protein [Lachnoclostridium sp.]MCM1211033.1 trypsin-like peptidase domain-containing protein [Blautia sp.]